MTCGFRIVMLSAHGHAEEQSNPTFGGPNDAENPDSDGSGRQLVKPFPCGWNPEFSSGSATLVNENGVPLGPRFHLLARPKRFELLTFWFVARRSIQLSYGRILLIASLLAEREGFEPSMSF